jgi:N-acetylglucosaminyl-diphospho-decaprenol L-rhamnosyltransferase
VSEPVITIAVVSWNTRDLLARCLDSMHADADRGLAAVTVVDNGSADGSRELVRDRYPWVTLMEPSENLGFGRAVNAAAAKARSEWIAPSNADVELTPGALQALLAAGRAHPDAGAIAPRLLLPDGSTQHSVHRFPSPGLAATYGFGLYRLSRSWADRLCLEGHWDPARPREVDWAHGAFLLVRRDVFEQIGGFDETQWMYAEDIDIAWRLTKARRPVFYEPSAIVHHAVSAATRQAFGDFERDQRHMLASYVWLARRRGTFVARLTAVLNVTGAALRLTALYPLAAVSPGRRRARDLARRYLALHRAGLRVSPETAV